MTYGARLRELRAERQLSLRDVEERGGPNKDTMSLIERDVHKPYPQTLGRIAKALGMDVSSLRFELESAERPPLGPAPTSQQPTLNRELEEERRARWDAVVQEARQLRKTGRTQMQRALDAWRESKDRGEPDAIRDKHLAEMNVLLKEAYDAQKAVGGAYMQAALKQSSDAPLPAYLREETGAATDFYIDLWRLVQDAGLSIRTSSKQAGKQAEPEKRPIRIVDDKAAA